MPSRQEIASRKLALIEDLRRTASEGRVRAGEVSLSQRELSQRYGLSVGVVGQTLQKLIGEGVLYSVPNVGTFFGRPRSDAFEFYLLVLPRAVGENDGSRDFYATLQMGFDERIAQCGGTSLTMTRDAALAAQRNGELPPLAGVFNFGQNVHNRGWQHALGVPHVCFEAMIEDADTCDVVGFDNEGGGRLAANHLLRNGHRRIAFLAGHNQDTAPRTQWSAQREAGWRQTLEQAGIETRALALSPDSEGAQLVAEHFSHHLPVAQQVAAAHIGPRGLEAEGEPISALVTFNDAAAMGVLRALRDANVPTDLWPAIVGFDNAPGADSQVLTSLRLPWEEIGGAAAELLWARRHGELVGPPTYRAVSMRVLPRLTCRSAWSRHAGYAALAAA